MNDRALEFLDRWEADGLALDGNPKCECVIGLKDRHSVPSFGVMSFSPKRASSVAPMANSPGRPAPGR
jgi:hypothetical protein